MITVNKAYRITLTVSTSKTRPPNWYEIYLPNSGIAARYGSKNNTRLYSPAVPFGVRNKGMNSIGTRIISTRYGLFILEDKKSVNPIKAKSTKKIMPILIRTACKNVKGYGIAVFAICNGRFQPSVPNAISGSPHATII